MLRSQLQTRLLLAAALGLAAVADANADKPDNDAWRPSTRYTSMQPSTAGTPNPVGTAGVSGAPHVSTAALPADCAGGYREETYTVRRPVIETSLRDERCVRYEPVTTFVPQQVDQGTWVDEQVVRNGRTTTRLRWMEGGWTVDPATGREYWRIPMLRPVRVQQPDKVETVRVWKPNVVTMSVPQVSYQPRVHVRQVPIQTVRYVEEKRVRRVPTGARRLFGAPGAERSGPQKTFVDPPAEPSPLGAPATSPSDLPASGIPAPPAPPPPALPQPSIDPRENVPGPFILPQNQSGRGNIQRTGELLPDRVAAEAAAGSAVSS
jgi:hypothetical protein